MSRTAVDLLTHVVDSDLPFMVGCALLIPTVYTLVNRFMPLPSRAAVSAMASCDDQKITRPAVVPTISPKTLRLRLELISRPINVNTAMEKLNIQLGTQAYHIFQALIVLSKDIRYVYDPVYEKEFIIVLHPYRDFLAVYRTTPLYYDTSLAYSVIRSSQFFIDNNLDHILEREYRRYVAVRCIQRHRSFRNWLEKPRTNDGRLGITCRLALKASQACFPSLLPVGSPPSPQALLASC